jgi:hypothetical protein
MTCFFDHNWGWPRKRGDKDIQVCLDCGRERESKVHFDGPRYRRTQNGFDNFIDTAPDIEHGSRQPVLQEVRSAAA